MTALSGKKAMHHTEDPQPATALKLDYLEARQLFLSAVASATTTTLSQVPGQAIIYHRAEAVPLEGHTDLFTDVAVFRSRTSNTPQRSVIVVSSGVHGIEGFAGSLLQRLILKDSSLLRNLLEVVDLVFIHAVNPWGMARHERTDQNNIDLNRNAHDCKERFQQINTVLPALRHILAPERPAKTRSRRAGLAFYGAVGGALVRLGARKATAAVMHGHYEYPKDLFFGGSALCSHLESVAGATARLLAAEHPAGQTQRPCCVIDLHTGLGPSRQLTLIMGQAPPSRPMVRGGGTGAPQVGFPRTMFRCRYEQRRAPVIPGIFSEWLARRIEGAGPGPGELPPWKAIVFEVGTLGQGLVSDLRALRRLVLSNQLRHRGMSPGHEAGATRIRADFVDLFAPQDPGWWQEVRTARFADLATLLRTLAFGPLLVAGSEQPATVPAAVTPSGKASTCRAKPQQ